MLQVLSNALYFYCNRSGYFKSESKEKRMLKSQGSSNLNAYYTAGIQLYHLTNHKIKAIVSKTHYGHTCTLGHVALPQDIRHGIAGQLAMGVISKAYLIRCVTALEINLREHTC